MRIAIVADEFDPDSGGANTFQNMVLSGLCKFSDEYELVIINRSQSATIRAWNGIQIIQLKPNSFNKIPNVLLNFYNRIKQTISFQSLNSNYHQNSNLNRVILKHNIQLVWFISPHAEILNVPYFVTIWDLQHRKQPWFPEVQYEGWTWDERETHYKKILPRASMVIVGTKQGKSEVIQYYGVDPQNILVNPFPAPALPDDLNNKAESTSLANLGSLRKPYFIYPAQFWPHKNHINLLHALSEIRNSSNSCPILIFTGSDKGNKNYVLKKITELGLESYVVFADFVSRVDLYGLMKNATGMVFVTYFGPDNIPPLEAFSVGCPVIASNVEGGKEQLGDAALWVNPNSPREISMAMIELLNNQGLSDELRLKGYDVIKNLNINNYLSLLFSEIDRFKLIRRNWP